MDETLDALLDASRRGEDAVLVTIAAVKGSAPREAGAKMIVLRDTTSAGVIGSIGGGHLEFKAIGIARQMLAARDDAQLRVFPLGATLGQCCGGLVQLLFEPVAVGAPWLETLAAHVRAAEPCVIVTTAHASAPGRKLLVSPRTAFGTLGDAALDEAALTMARARGVSVEGTGTRLLELREGDCACLCLFDPYRPVSWRIVLFGAGHVGQALVRTLSAVPCRVTWVDTRDGVFPHRMPANVDTVTTDAPRAEVAAAPAGAYFLVMTHSHLLDEELSESILRRNDFTYFGLIGSATKRRRFEQRLAARGIDPTCLAAMTCPIGVPGIKDKRPHAIAIAVAAELLQRHESGGVLPLMPRRSHRLMGSKVPVCLTSPNQTF